MELIYLLGIIVVSVSLLIRMLLYCLGIWALFHFKILDAIAFVAISEFIRILMSLIVDKTKVNEDEGYTGNE
ncbi:hypothetical protein [Anabaena lutea]|uniref:Uncharacterized protein n=1 Tax=Anabaena lutea FACHB-196 TaxID=2692881 RepID=A0ABR8FK12_9NOST|nr:hypothetical protein [Anabaena lutea]MBD2570017.1 hypothetical protein [Anabaena lutea FACHB-196]